MLARKDEERTRADTGQVPVSGFRGAGTAASVQTFRTGACLLFGVAIVGPAIDSSTVLCNAMLDAITISARQIGRGRSHPLRPVGPGPPVVLPGSGPDQ